MVERGIRAIAAALLRHLNLTRSAMRSSDHERKVCGKLCTAAFPYACCSRISIYTYTSTSACSSLCSWHTICPLSITWLTDIAVARRAGSFPARAETQNALHQWPPHEPSACRRRCRFPSIVMLVFFPLPNSTSDHAELAEKSVCSSVRHVLQDGGVRGGGRSEGVAPPAAERAQQITHSH